MKSLMRLETAILLKSGFNRWDAARAQLLTAGAGLMGALVAIGGSGVTSTMGELVLLKRLHLYLFPIHKEVKQIFRAPNADC